MPSHSLSHTLPYPLIRRFFSMTVLALGLQACTVEKTPVFSDRTDQATFSNNYSQQVYHALTAELYRHYGDLTRATDHYSQIMQDNDSLAVAKRLTRLALEHSDYPLALTSVERWVKQAPNALDARQFRALLNIRHDHPKKAAEDLVWLQKAMDKKDPGQGTLFVTSIVSLEAEKEKAFKAFKAFTELTGEVTHAKLALTALALNAKKFDEAKAAIEPLLNSKKTEDQERAHLLYSKALVGLGQKQQALESLAPYYKTSKNRELKLEYARLLIVNDQTAKALTIYQELSQTYPNNSDVFYTLGLLHLEKKQFKAALPILQHLTELPGRRAEGYYFLGEAYEGLEQFDKALEAYQQAMSKGFQSEAQIRIVGLIKDTQGVDAALDYLRTQHDKLSNNDDRFQAYMLEGSLFFDEKRYQEALQAYTASKIVKPEENIDRLYAESLVYTAMQEIPKAETNLRQILQTEPKNASALNALGYTLALHTERWDEAKKLIEQALEIRPDDPAITDSLAWVEYRLGNLQRAEALLRKAYKNLPDPEVAAHLIEVLFRAGKKTEAQTMLNKELGKHPNDDHLKAMQDKLIGGLQ